MRITMIGHSTVLVENGSRRILTDPYFGTLGNPAYKRLAPPARSREQLGEVDLILVSHNHWDHLDGRYLRGLAQSVSVVAPRRTCLVTRLKGARNVVGMRAWESRTFDGIVVTAVPALHVTPCIGFVFQLDGRRVYFAGDTYYRPFMAAIGRELRPDIALIPVTTFRIPMTMGEKSAARAVGDLQPSVVIPIHLGVVPRWPLLRTTHSPQGFARRVREAGIQTQVVVLAEGESWEG